MIITIFSKDLNSKIYSIHMLKYWNLIHDNRTAYLTYEEFIYRMG